MRMVFLVTRRTRKKDTPDVSRLNLKVCAKKNKIKLVFLAFFTFLSFSLALNFLFNARGGTCDVNVRLENPQRQDRFKDKD